MNKETSYQKLKRELKEANEENNKLYCDFKAYSRGDFTVKVLYDTVFKIEDDTEKIIWMGSTNE